MFSLGFVTIFYARNRGFLYCARTQTSFLPWAPLSLSALFKTPLTLLNTGFEAALIVAGSVLDQGIGTSLWRWTHTRAHEGVDRAGLGTASFGKHLFRNESKVAVKSVQLSTIMYLKSFQVRSSLFFMSDIYSFSVNSSGWSLRTVSLLTKLILAWILNFLTNILSFFLSFLIPALPAAIPSVGCVSSTFAFAHLTLLLLCLVICLFFLPAGHCHHVTKYVLLHMRDQE